MPFTLTGHDDHQIMLGRGLPCTRPAVLPSRRSSKRVRHGKPGFVLSGVVSPLLALDLPEEPQSTCCVPIDREAAVVASAERDAVKGFAIDLDFLRAKELMVEAALYSDLPVVALLVECRLSANQPDATRQAIRILLFDAHAVREHVV